MDKTQALDAINPEVSASAEQAVGYTALSMHNGIRALAGSGRLLSESELDQCFDKFIAGAKEPIAGCGGAIIRADRDRVVARFSASDDPVPHARRALAAAAGLLVAADRYRRWVNARFGERNLPGIAFATGVYSAGTVVTQPVTDSPGDGAILAMRLESAARTQGCWLLASAETARSAGPGIRTGRAHSLALKPDGSGPAIEALEVSDIDGVAAVDELRQAQESNARISGVLRAAALAAAPVAAPATAPPQPALDIKLPVKGYRALRKLGQGGMSTVYLIERQNDGLRLALKLLDTADTDDPKMLGLFIQEYEVLDLVTHPNVVAIYDQGVTDQGLFILMEYFASGDLRRQIRAGLTPAAAVQITLQVAKGLSEVHRHGVVHRDLKPANLMVRSDATVAVADFGIAKVVTGSILRSRSSGIMGTPYYISPEQIEDGKIDQRSDLYALGVIFYEMLTRTRPYDGESISQILRQHRDSPIPRLPVQAARHQPIIDRLMAKKPDERYQSALELIPDLLGFGL